jgi:hypothetical protein
LKKGLREKGKGKREKEAAGAGREDSPLSLFPSPFPIAEFGRD